VENKKGLDGLIAQFGPAAGVQWEESNGNYQFYTVKEGVRKELTYNQARQLADSEMVSQVEQTAEEIAEVFVDYFADRDPRELERVLADDIEMSTGIRPYKSRPSTYKM
jgi:hypothetical protein